MTIEQPLNIVNSVLEVKAVGSVQDLAQELELPEGKSIQELLDDQKKEDENNPTT
jgi:hypothetical protein